MTGAFHMTRLLPGRDFDDTIRAVTVALAAEGFGVLSDIDVAATLKARLGLDLRPYRILGACNPGFASRALAIEDRIGVLLPCNVVVQAKPEGIEVAAVDPVASIGRAGRPELAAIAAEVRERLARVVDSL